MTRIVTAVILDEQNRLLPVRKTGTLAFMQPGGKPEPGETDLQTLGRELKEELGCEIDTDSARFLGAFRAIAANEPGEWVEALTYEVRLDGTIAAAGEIDAIIWLDPLSPGEVHLAPLTREHILPLAADASIKKTEPGKAGCRT